MNLKRFHTFIIFLLASFVILPILVSDDARAALIPEWVKNTAKWYGDDLISEDEFLNAIKFLIENGILEIEEKKENEILEKSKTPTTAEVIIPNGNAEQANTGFYVPLNLEVNVGSTVVWVNVDNVLHTVQSQSEDGSPSGLFNSDVLATGQRFAFKFEESGTYNYYCTLHPWRVGQVTVV